MNRAPVIAAIEAARRTPFRPGTHDCALFVASVVQAKTGKDYAKKWRGKYKTVDAGVKALKKAGYEDHIALVESTFKEIPVSAARFGDIAVVGDALGIVSGHVIFVLRPEGLGTVDLLTASRAFRVA